MGNKNSHGNPCWAWRYDVRDRGGQQKCYNINSMKNPKILSHKATVIIGLVVTFIGGLLKLGLVITYFGLLLLIFGLVGWLVDFFKKKKDNKIQTDK